MPNTLEGRLETLSGPGNRLSRGYTLAAYLFLFAAAMFWLPFASAAAGFFFGGFLLRREGL